MFSYWFNCLAGFTQEAHITNATSTNTNHNAFYQKTSGITASVSSSMVDSAKSIDGLIDATQESQSTRLKAMGVLAAAAKTKNLLDQAKQGSLSSIRAQATLGTSTNKNQSTSSHQSNQASTINTDGNLIFNIQGKGTDSDLVITGSHINVGNDLYQKVAGDVIYQASTQTSTTNTQNSSKGAGFGVYANVDIKSQQQTGAGFTAHANLGKGSSTETATTHTNTTVQVAGATHNDIAGNFILDGANLMTKHLTGTLGGDLIVKSRQDTYQYDSKQQNISGSADIDFSGKLQNANINAGKQQLNAQYAQVTNQSGIIANTSSLNVQGQGKFTGGYLITDANQNHTQFKQGIQTQDIHNHLNYQGDALQVGVSIAPKSKSSQDSTSNKTKHQLGLSGLGYGKIDPIHKTSITKSAITDQAGLSHINTGNLSSKDSQQALNPIISNDFTNQKSQLEKELGGQTTVTTEFGREIPKQIGDYAQDKEIELLAQGNIEEAKKWAEGGVYRVALHTAMGALATGTAEGAVSAGIGTTVGGDTASTANNVGQVQWNYLTHVSLEKVRKGQLTMREAEQLSERLDKEAQKLCSNNPTSDACRTAISSQIQYIAMQEAWSVMRNDVSRTSKQTFDYLYNTPNANTRFVTYFNTIDNRANFFAASNQYEKNLGVGARWFGGANDVSRARFTGLGADGNLSYITFGVGSVFSGNPKHIYDWRKEAGDALMKGGFDNFRYLYNNRPNAMQWDIKQLRDEQALLQPIHEKYLSDANLFRWFSNQMTDSENRKYTGKLIKEEQTQPGGIDILDKSSRIRYGCKLLGYTEQQGCKP